MLHNFWKLSNPGIYVILKSRSQLLPGKVAQISGFYCGWKMFLAKVLCRCKLVPCCVEPGGVTHNDVFGHKVVLKKSIFSNLDRLHLLIPHQDLLLNHLLHLPCLQTDRLHLLILHHTLLPHPLLYLPLFIDRHITLAHITAAPYWVEKGTRERDSNYAGFSDSKLIFTLCSWTWIEGQILPSIPGIGKQVVFYTPSLKF